jgi:NADH-quinone oxidoreductase subunit L
MLGLALTILLAPLIGFVIQFFLGRRLPGQGAWLTVATIGISFVAALMIFFPFVGGHEPVAQSWDWFSPGGPGSTPWTIGIHIDGLTAIMLVVVTLVAFLVHLFSTSYMKGDPKYWLFFAWLQMFSVAMLILVLAGNLLHLFMGWELVGLCSYKLIGFWSEKAAPGNAARKAFITTRIGDVGMLVALGVIYMAAGSFEFSEIFDAVRAGSLADPWLTIAGLGLFFAAMGKSAQAPLHVWLPDAMEGPTPVSALIHAATMVAAGVYLIGRFMPILTPDVLVVIATVGAITAVMAGLIALAQNDIKKVLAYSTVSQLGYMFIGLGVGAWHAGLFHLTTHAFFKALMFLGSGSVIHACHHEQDMRKMGGLLKKMPITGWTFLAGVLAIAGLPWITAGFFSKDAILAGAWHRFPALYWMALAGAVLTAFYMMRLFVMTFLGKPRDAHVHDHAHESPPSMTIPLVVLGVLAICAGWGSWHGILLNPEIVADAAGVTAVGVATVGDLHDFEHSVPVMLMAITAGLLGLGLGVVVFRVMREQAKDALKAPFRGLERAFAHKFWFDELYREVVLRPAYGLARAARFVDERAVDGLVNTIGRFGRDTLAGLSGRTDTHVVDGAVHVVGWVPRVLGAGMGALQSGRIRLYLSVSAGALALALVLGRIL